MRTKEQDRIRKAFNRAKEKCNAELMKKVIEAMKNKGYSAITIRDAMYQACFDGVFSR